MRGWIALCNSRQTPEAARAQLKTLGITVGEYNQKQQEFVNCEVPDEAMEKLDPLWATEFVWGLK